MARLLLLLCLLITLSACQNAATKQRVQSVAVPQQWQSLAHEQATSTLAQISNAPLQTQWWMRFHDPLLNQLIAQAIPQNNDLKIAYARLQQAQANVRAQRASFLPDFTFSLNATRGDSLILTGPAPINQFETSINVNYDTDVFGQKRKQYEALRAQVHASKAYQRQVLIMLLADVSRNYLQIRLQQNQLQLLEKDLNTQSQMVALTSNTFHAGLSPEDDYLQAKANYDYLLACRHPLEIQLTAAKNRLAILLGISVMQLPASLDEIKNIPIADSQIILQAPASVLAQRPDIAQAKHDLQAATAIHESAIAALYPDLSLTGLLGWQKNNFIVPGFPTFLSGQLWSIGGNVLAPIFNFGGLQAQVASKSAKQQQAFLNYQQTILKALAEVETNLNSYLQTYNREQQLAQALSKNNKLLTLAKRRYQIGLSGKTAVLQAEHIYYATQMDHLNAQGQRTLALIDTYQSLGGGWNT